MTADPLPHPSAPWRRLPVGAEVAPGGETVHFRVWAPRAKRVDVALQDGIRAALTAEPDGYFAGLAAARAGALYRYQLDGGALYPDPASRFQPDGPHGPPRVVGPAEFRWTDEHRRGA